VAKVNKNETTSEKERSDGNLVLDHIAEYIVQSFIKEDVNSFPETTLMHDLLVYKLGEQAKPLMIQTINRVASELKDQRKLDLKQRVGGITQAKRISFRSDDQYNAFISLFFYAIEDRPDLIEFIDDEQDFENFMLYCIYEFRDFWNHFVADIVEERLKLEREKNLYAYRSSKSAELEELPTYADFIAERMETMAESGYK